MIFCEATKEIRDIIGNIKYTSRDYARPCILGTRKKDMRSRNFALISQTTSVSGELIPRAQDGTVYVIGIRELICQIDRDSETVRDRNRRILDTCSSCPSTGTQVKSVTLTHRYMHFDILQSPLIERRNESES